MSPAIETLSNLKTIQPIRTRAINNKRWALRITDFLCLGILLLFSGAQLAISIIDLKECPDTFVTVLILGITLASNLAAGFLVGMVVAYFLKWPKLNV